MTLINVSDAVNAVVNRDTGPNPIAFPNGSYLGQCTVPVVDYVQQLTSIPNPGFANDRADDWGTNFPEVLAPYFTHESYQAGKTYPEGTILMWDSPHIAIVISSDGSNTVKVFEQNADPTGSACHIANRIVNESGFHTCTYALIPIIEAPGTPLSYTVENIVTKTIQLTQASPLWNLEWATTEAMDSNPLQTYQSGYQETTAAIAHRSDGTNYYLVGNNSTTGFNVADCEDYIPPPPTVPYVPPAAPVAVTKPQTYTLLDTVKYYSIALDALHDQNATGTIAAGKYFIFSTTNGMYNLTTDNMKDQTQWINPSQNVAPPLPPPVPAMVLAPPQPTYKPSEVPIGTEADTDWKKDYTSFNADRSPDTYKMLIDYTMKDYGGTRGPIALSEGKHINVPGKFPKNGVWFYRPRDYKNDVTFSWYYGIPLFDDNGNPTMVKVVEEALPKHFSDLFRLWKDDIKNYLGDKPIMDVLVRHKTKEKK